MHYEQYYTVKDVMAGIRIADYRGSIYICYLYTSGSSSLFTNCTQLISELLAVLNWWQPKA